jgi:hypothetical protein
MSGIIAVTKKLNLIGKQAMEDLKHTFFSNQLQ